MPGPYDDLISQAEQNYDLPPGLLGRVINTGEASGPNATSPKGAMGVAQLMPATASELGVTNPYDPAQSIDAGARYLSQQVQAFGDPTLAVAAYNAGPGAVRKYGGVPPYPETQAYVARTLPGPDQTQSLPADADIDAAMKAGGASETPQAAAAPTSMPYDADLSIKRGADGSIASMGGGVGFSTRDPKTGGWIDTPGVTSDPGFIANFLAKHPEDPANNIGLPSEADLDKAMQGQTPVEDPSALGQAPAQPGTPPAGAAQGVAPAASQPSSPYGLPHWLDAIYAGAKQFENSALMEAPNRFAAGVEAIPAAVTPMLHGDMAGAGQAYLKSFSDNFGRLQGIDHHYAQQYPVGNIVNSLAGGAVSATIFPEIKAATRVGRAAVGAGQAAFLGGVNGAMNSRGDVGDMFKAGTIQAAVAAPFGAGLGAAVGPGVAHSISDSAPKLSDFNATGIDPALAVNGPKSLQKVGQGLKGLPFIGAPLEAMASRTAGQGAAAAENLASRYGTAADPYQAGAAMQQGANDAVAGMKATENKLYQPINQLEANPTPLSAGTTQRAIGDLYAAYPTIPDWLSKNAPQLAGLKSTLDGAGGKLTFGELKSVRSDVGRILGDNISNIDRARLSKVYGALSDDMYAGAAQLGGQPAFAALSRADTFAAASRQRISDTLDTVINAKSGEDAYGKVVAMAGSTQRADIAQLTRLRRSLDPDSFNQVGAAVIRRLGDNGQGGFSAGRFASAWGKLSPEGKGALFGGMDSHLADLNSLARIAKAQQGAEKFYNHSNSGHQGMLDMLLIGGGDLLAKAAQGELPGAVRDAAFAATTGLAGRTVAGLLAGPKTARLVMSAMEAKSAASVQAAARDMTAYAARNPADADNVINFRDEYLKRLKANAPVSVVGGASSAIANDRVPQPPRMLSR